MGRSATDKRERLVASAIDCFHLQGYADTTLADVAKSADVPVGNIFYYFKTKAALAEAVIDEWCVRLAGYLLPLDNEKDPWARLKQFLFTTNELGKMYVALGCPLASLIRDLRQAGEPLSSQATRIYQVQFNWMETQFIQLAFPQTQSQCHTRFMMSGLQGAILLAYAQGDESILTQEIQHLEDWLTAQQVFLAEQLEKP